MGERFMSKKETIKWSQMNKKDLAVWAALALLGFCYFFLLGERGYTIFPDSYSYIYAGYEREPFYPIVLMICKAIFKEAYFLYAVAILQGMTAWVVSLFVVRKMQEYLQLNRLEVAGTYVLLLLPYGLDTMWAEPRVNYTHIIISDCFSYAFFYLFIVAMLTYLYEKRTSAYLWMLGIAAVMTLNRNQMQLLFVIIAFVSVIHNCIRTKKRAWKKCALEIVGVCATMVVTSLLTLCYFYAQWGYFEKSSENNFTMMTNMIYTADAEDVELFEDEEAGQVFADLYAQADASGWTRAYAKEGFYHNGEHMIYCHDHIKSLIIRPYFENYVSSLGMEPKGFESDRIKKEIASEIQSVLWKEHFGDWLYNAFCIVPKGFVYSVMPVIFPGTYGIASVVAAVIWVAFVIGVLYLLLCKKAHDQDSDLVTFVVSVAGFMVLNIVALCLVIFVEYRYLNYTQGLFFVVFYLLCRNIFRLRKRERTMSGVNRSGYYRCWDVWIWVAPKR